MVDMSKKTISDELDILGETLTPGREFKVGSSRTHTRYVFLRHVVHEDGDEWVEALGKEKGDFRAFEVSTVAKVMPIPNGGIPDFRPSPKINGKKRAARK